MISSTQKLKRRVRHGCVQEWREQGERGREQRASGMESRLGDSGNVKLVKAATFFFGLVDVGGW